MLEPLKLVEHLPGLADARVERKLSSGPLSEKWLLASEAGQWVLRKDRPLAAQLDLDRQCERVVLAELAASGWCSDALWGDAQQGILVVPFVPGRAWAYEDMQQSDQLGRLAILLCRLHNCSAQVPPFRLDDRVKSYARYLGAPPAAQCAENIRHLLAETAASGCIAVCHNDPVAGNVIDDGELHLIDFEFAAAGDPLFDLAAVIEHHRLPAAMVEVFTEAYRQAGGSCDMRLLEQWRMVYSQTAGLWNQIVAG
jgi:thiamine kinase